MFRQTDILYRMSVLPLNKYPELANKRGSVARRGAQRGVEARSGSAARGVAVVLAGAVGVAAWVVLGVGVEVGARTRAGA